MKLRMKADDRKFWVAFSRIPGIGQACVKLFEKHFGTLEMAWRAGLTELRAAGLDQGTARSVATRKLGIDPDAELQRLADGGVSAITWHDDDYPPKLVLDYTDILEELNLSSVGDQMEMTALFPQDERDGEVLKHVTYDPIHIDQIIRSSGQNISTVSSVMAMMELKGMVRQVGGMNYIRLKEASAEYSAV